MQELCHRTHFMVSGACCNACNQAILADAARMLETVYPCYTHTHAMLSSPRPGPPSFPQVTAGKLCHDRVCIAAMLRFPLCRRSQKMVALLQH